MAKSNHTDRTEDDLSTREGTQYRKGTFKEAFPADLAHISERSEVEEINASTTDTAAKVPTPKSNNNATSNDEEQKDRDIDFYDEGIGG